MTKGLRGFDTYAGDGNHPDYAAAKAAGYTWCWLKKSDHVYADAAYARLSDAARKAGITVGAYMMPQPGHSAATAKEQVTALRTLPGDIHRDGTDLPVVVDVESSIGFAKLGRPIHEIVEFYRQVMLEVADQFGALPVIYTGYFQWADLGFPAIPHDLEMPVWIKTAYVRSARQVVPEDDGPPPHYARSNADPREYHRVPDAWAGTGWCANQWDGDALQVPGHDRQADVSTWNAVRQGSKDPLVQWYQRRLNAIAPVGADVLVADGDLGARTAARLAAFQGSRGLAADGVAGPRTFAALAWTSK